jgi:hypothetical protein
MRLSCIVTVVVTLFGNGSFCCCTAIACHQCYFLQAMKHLMILTWIAGTDIVPVIQ